MRDASAHRGVWAAILGPELIENHPVLFDRQLPDLVEASPHSMIFDLAIPMAGIEVKAEGGLLGLQRGRCVELAAEDGSGQSAGMPD